MPRISRAVAVGLPHHITQRGNYRQNVFDSDDDMLQYLEWLKLYSSRHALKIWAYCLMRNHVHFIAVPMEPDSMAKALKILHMRHSLHSNRRSNSIGHLWQGRFYSCALDERHLLAAVRYVENNPVRAGLVKRAEEYRWSSAPSHVHKTEDPALSGDFFLLSEIVDWSAYLELTEDPLVDAVRQCTRVGRPCGDEDFVRGIEAALGRTLKPMPRGRPRTIQ